MGPDLIEALIAHHTRRSWTDRTRFALRFGQLRAHLAGITG